MTRNEAEKKRIPPAGYFDEALDRILEDEAGLWFIPNWYDFNIDPARIREKEKGTWQ